MIIMNLKNRKHTKKKHLEISQEADNILKNIVQGLNDELEGKYYEWQVMDISIKLFDNQIKMMDSDRKQELLQKTMEVKK